jgi:hypothetical protein
MSLYKSHNEWINERVTDQGRFAAGDHFALQNIALLKPMDVQGHVNAMPEEGLPPTKVWTRPNPDITKIVATRTNKFW